MLARMASDDAADLLLEIEQDRRLPVLDLLPAAKQRKIKRLLGHNPSTAGGLMNPDFVCACRRRHGRQTSLARARRERERARRRRQTSERVVARVARSRDRGARLAGRSGDPSAAAEADSRGRAPMTDYNLVSVLDAEGSRSASCRSTTCSSSTLPEVARATDGRLQPDACAMPGARSDRPMDAGRPSGERPRSRRRWPRARRPGRS